MIEFGPAAVLCMKSWKTHLEIVYSFIWYLYKNCEINIYVQHIIQHTY